MIKVRSALIGTVLAAFCAGILCLGAAQNLPQLLITEVSLHRPEFVEIYNPTDQEVSLRGLWFCYYPASRTSWDTPWRSKQFPDQAILRPHSYFLLTLGDDEEGRDLLTDWNAYGSMMLNGSGGTVAILSDSPDEGEVIDALGWGSARLSSGMAAQAAPDGKSLARAWGASEEEPFQDTEDNASDFHTASLAPSSGTSGATLCAMGSRNMYRETGNIELSLCNAGPNLSTFSIHVTSESGHSARLQPATITLDPGNCGLISIQSKQYDYYVIDLETTGLDANACSIIEVAWVFVQDGEVVQSDSSLIFTEGQLAPYITQLTGITPEMLQKAPRPEEVIPLVLERLGGMSVLSYSANEFDRRFLEASARSLELDLPDIQWIDALTWVKAAMPNLVSHSLQAVAEALEIQGSHHRALSDALITNLVYQEALRRLGSHIEVVIRTEDSKLPVGVFILPTSPL